MPRIESEAFRPSLTFENNLRRSLSARLVECTDPELRKLLTSIQERRASRRPILEEALGTKLAKRTLRDEPGTLLEVSPVGDTVRILRVARPTNFRFTAGQSVKLGLPGGTTHSYSIASAPGDSHLEFCIELVAGGRLTPKLFALAPGARLALGERPKGKFVLQRDKQRHVMLATVTGIAPLLSMLRDVLVNSTSTHEFWILHGASYADELPYRDELEALAQASNVSYEPTVSRPGEAQNRGFTGQVGRVDSLATRLVERVGSPDEVAVYACGNPGMIDNVQRQLAARGYSVLSEAFK